MKTEILIPDKLITQVQQYFNSYNKTNNIIAALQEWLAYKEAQELDKQAARPLEFLPGFGPHDNLLPKKKLI